MGAPPTARGGAAAHLPLQSSQRAKEQCGASLCMRVAVSSVTTSCTPRTAWGEGTRRAVPARRSQAHCLRTQAIYREAGARLERVGVLGSS